MNKPNEHYYDDSEEYEEDLKKWQEEQDKEYRRGLESPSSKSDEYQRRNSYTQKSDDTPKRPRGGQPSW